MTASSGPDQSFTKVKGVYAGAKHSKNNRNRSMMDGSGTTNTHANASPISDSYKNVEFFAVKEPYHVVKNKFDNSSPKKA